MASNPQNKKLVQEIIGLVVVAIIAFGYFAYNAKQSAKTATTSVQKATPLNTSFDTGALDKVNTQERYPDVSPKAGDLGKTDPFSQ